MSKAATLRNQKARYKALAQSYLAQTRELLRQLSADRQRDERRRTQRPSLVFEVKAILYGV